MDEDEFEATPIMLPDTNTVEVDEEESHTPDLPPPPFSMPVQMDVDEVHASSPPISDNQVTPEKIEETKGTEDDYEDLY